MIVCNLPHHNKAYENCVYLHSSDVARLIPNPHRINFVQVNGNLIFEAKSQNRVESGHTTIQPGHIGMGKIQRQASKLSVDDTVDVVAYAPPQDENLNLVYIEFEMSPLKMHEVLFVEEDAIITKVTEKFKDQVFCSGMVWLIDVEGHPCRLTTRVLKVAAIDAEAKEDGIGLVVDKGVLTAHSHVVVNGDARYKNLNIQKSETQRSGLFGPEFRYGDMGIGGLDAEFANIFRRAFASRTLSPAMVRKLGIDHVRGLLLYGPPGTGKTLIARQIGKMLHGREPKLVNGPEILNKYVGESEKNIRELFADAEADQKANGENSDLHIIIFDELDAICKHRGTTSGSTGVGDTVVNQLLSKLDGVDQLNNILVIGMTNRKDMIDDALLRPGRFEVHIEIGLPDYDGRVEIFKIHTKKMRENDFLGSDVNFNVLGERTKNFSGAEIAGLIKSATSFASYGNLNIRDENISLKDVAKLKVCMEHFNKALEEVKPAFGVAAEDLHQSVRNGIIPYGRDFVHLHDTCKKIVSQVKSSEKFPLQSVLLEGFSGSGMTALAAQLAIDGEFPFTKLISPEDFVGWTEQARCNRIAKVFNESYRSPSSLIILDNIERLLSYVDIGPRFSNPVLQTLLVLLKRVPPPDQRTGAQRSLLIIGTTSSQDVLQQMGIIQAFNVVLNVPRVSTAEEIVAVFKATDAIISETDLKRISSEFERPIGIKTLLMIMEMASQQSNEGRITYDEFVTVAHDCGVDLSYPHS